MAPPRIATLNDVNKSSDDDDQPSEYPIADRVRQLKSAAPDEQSIYWEFQGKDRMCALHCLNTLLQVFRGCLILD